MRRWLIALIAIILWSFVVIGAAGAWVLSRPAPDDLDALIRAEMDAQNVNAVAFGRVDAGDITELQGYGGVEAETTPFQIASVSKPLAAWGVLALVEDGQLTFETPVNDLLARWQFPDSAYDESEVTVAQLLSHTGGVSLSGYEGYTTGNLQTLVESLEGAADTPQNEAVTLFQAPGSGYSYSGGGYSVLQLLVEEVSGQPFAEYMQTAVFAPLGMDATTYTPPGDLAPVYDENGEQQPAREFIAYAAGGAYSTAQDMARWLLATVTPRAEALFTPQPNAAPGLGVEFGLGYYLERTLRENTLVVWHDGSNPPGWRSYLAAVPEADAGIVLLTNSPGGAELNKTVECAWVRQVTGDLTPQCALREVEALGPVMAIAGLAGMMVIVVIAGRSTTRGRS